MAASLFWRACENSIYSFGRRQATKCLVSGINCTTAVSSHSILSRFQPQVVQTANLRTNNGASWNITKQKPMLAEQEIVPDTTKEDKTITNSVILKINEQLRQKAEGRLFAVVQVCGKQFKVTSEDVIVIEGYWQPEIGDKLKLEKVLLAGCSDFTLIGRPILSRELVAVEATVIEKTLSHTKTHFRKKRRKQYMRINFHRSPYTMLRINSIKIQGDVNLTKDIEGLEERIF